jgi:hypothetical protein
LHPWDFVKIKMKQGKGDEGYAAINAALDAGAYAVLLAASPGAAADVRVHAAQRAARSLRLQPYLILL